MEIRFRQHWLILDPFFNWRGKTMGMRFFARWFSGVIVSPIRPAGKNPEMKKVLRASQVWPMSLPTSATAGFSWPEEK
jgi:hypothetical protein